MDIEKIIADLKEERNRLSGIIAALERLKLKHANGRRPSRRGRKFMDKDDRKEVSERMTRYWEERRKKERDQSTAATERSAGARTGDEGVNGKTSGANPGS